MTLETFKRDILPLKDKLFRYAKSIVSNVELAEDVVQETMLKVWEKRELAHTINNIEAWCMTVARNFALAKYRSKANQVNELDPRIDPIEKADTPAEILEKEDILNKIDTIVLKLPLKQKEVFQLRDIEGYSYQEIADITSYQLSDVKVSVYRARKTLKENLERIYAYERY